VRRTEPTASSWTPWSGGSASYDTFTPVMARPGKEGLSKVAGVIDGVLAKPAAAAVASHPPALGPRVTGDEGGDTPRPVRREPEGGPGNRLPG
jgi:hypothetical protein